MEYLVIVGVSLLIIVGIRETSDSTEAPVINNQTMPDDDVHKELKNQSSESPGKKMFPKNIEKESCCSKKLFQNPADTCNEKLC